MKPVKEIAFEHIAGIEPSGILREVAEELHNNRSVDLRTTSPRETAGRH